MRITGTWEKGSLQGKVKIEVSHPTSSTQKNIEQSLHLLFEGEFVERKMKGHGSYFYTNGFSYVGDYKGNMPHGIGKMAYLGGFVYEGNWSKGKRHGKGTLKRI